MMWYVIVDSCGLLYNAESESFGGAESATCYESLDNLPEKIKGITYDRELIGYYDGNEEVYSPVTHFENDALARAGNEIEESMNLED